MTRKQRSADEIAHDPSVEQMIAELNDAGWQKISAAVWKAPTGGYFRGPFGAWKAMKEQAAQGSEGALGRARR